MTKAVDGGASKTQEWFRRYSSRLYESFRAAGLVEHRVTKGETREHQILDLLRGVLPTRSALGRNVVIIDSADEESPKFDGVLFDRAEWPRLFQDQDLEVVMIESVLAALEIKSSLTLEEIRDIFKKSSALRSMRHQRNTPLLESSPRIAAFAYDCPNLNLHFFDFSVSFERNPVKSPSVVAILNQALFGVAGRHEKLLVPLDVPLVGAVPAWVATGRDTLLMFTYFLSRWIAKGSPAEEVFRLYSEALFASVGSFYFEDAFRQLIATDKGAHDRARKIFEGTARQDVSVPYTAARKSLGMN